MTIVVPIDPVTGQPITTMMSSPSASNRSEMMATISANLLETIAKTADEWIRMDSMAPQMSDCLKLTQRIPTVSGLHDNDYPNINEINGQTLRLSQFSCLTTIPLPKGLLEQFSHMQQNCEMGLITEISRAFIAIDSYIYLWKYDNGTDVAYYDALTETILGVGLVPPKPGVFKPHIKYLLVLTTATEIVILGITFSPTEDDKDLGDLLLVSEPIFRVPTDNVVMRVIRGTTDGRIFLGGKDGCLYEIVYQAEDGWFGSKCKKVNHSSSALSFFIPSFFNVSKEDPIIQTEIDENRHILYTLSESGTIDVFDLGSDGKFTNRVASKSQNSIVSEASSAAQTIDQMFFRPIVSISAIEMSESALVNLIAVTKSGVRLYFTVTSVSTISPEQRPFTLSLLHVRLPPGFTASSLTQKPSDVHISHFRKGTLLMISSQMDNKDLLWTITNDSFAFNSELIEIFSVVSIKSRIWKMAEEIKSDPFKRLDALKNIKSTDPPHLVTQHMEAARKFIFLTPESIKIGYKPRIVDQFLEILNETQGYDNEAVKSFFTLHTGRQGCAVALILACDSKQEEKIREWATSAFFLYGEEPQPTAQHFSQQMTQPVYGQQYVSPFHSDRFAQQLQQVSTPLSSPNQPLFSTPSSPIAIQTAQTGYYSPLNINSQMSPTDPMTGMATAMVPQHSNRYEAIFLYFSRIIRPIWDLKTVTSQKTISSDGPKDFLVSNISADEIKLCDRLSDLRDFMKQNIKFSPNFESETNQKKNIFKGNDILSNERNSLHSLLKLIEHCIEVLGLWKLLIDHQFHAITAVLPTDRQNQLLAVTFKELVIYGNEMTTQLAGALVRRFIEDNSTTDIINKRLQEVCPSIYKNENALYAKAHELVTKAKLIANPTDRLSQLETALNLCKKIGSRINLPVVCELFQSVQWFEAVVDICLLTAQNRDPQNLGLHYYRNGEHCEDQIGCQAFIARNDCYKLLLEIYERLVQQSKSLLSLRGHDSLHNVMTLEEAKNRSNDMLRHAIQSVDELFHISLYDWLYDHQQSDKLLEIKSPYLESYLKHKTSNFSDSIALMDLLWMYYERNGHFRAAAQILSKMAERRSSEVNLYSRLEYLSRAIVCMKSSDSRPTSIGGEYTQSAAGEFLHELEEKMEVARIQLHLLEHIQRLSDCPLTREAIIALNCDLLDITTLYEEFADRFSLAECQLAILHCAGHYDPNLIETIWQNIIDTELRALVNKPRETQKISISTKIKELGKLYISSEKYFPIEYIVKTIETKSLELDSEWLVNSLLELGIKLMDLLDLYHKLYKSRNSAAVYPREKVRLLQAIVYLIERFTKNQSYVNFSERRLFINKCLDVISGYLIDLQTMNPEDRTVKELLFKFKGLKAQLERCI